MESTIIGSEWYLDSGASYHMIGNKEYFSSLKEKNLKLHIEFGCYGMYSTKGIGTITFKSKSGSHIHLKNVLYVPGLNRKFIYVAV